MLITHRGLSGPAILQISSYWKPATPITLDLAPDQELTAALRDPKARRDLAQARAAFRAALPNRLADRWLDLHPPQGWSNHALDELERHVHHGRLFPKARKATRRPKSPPAAWTRTNFQPKPWSAAKCRGCISSAK